MMYYTRTHKEQAQFTHVLRNTHPSGIFPNDMYLLPHIIYYTVDLSYVDADHKCTLTQTK